ncbi:MAG: hypothetical protein WD578_11850 [Bacteroidales bacterium]
MKMNKVNIKWTALILIAVVMVIQGCVEDEMYPRTRLFQPVLNENLYAVNNTIVVNLGKMKDAESYLIEVSRDSFATVDYTVEIDTNFVILNETQLGEELLWFTIYQVQVTAFADETEYNSLPSFLGSVRTQKFPSNMGAPTFFDILDTRARVFWTPAGDPITNIKVFAENDLRLSDPLLEFDLDQSDIDSNLFIVNDLEPATTYQIAIYSGDELRGWELYTTRDALVSGDNVVDLTGIDSAEINLAFRLPDVADGSIILLEGGKTYLADGYDFDKSISFISGYSFVPALPVIDCSNNFNIVDASDIGYVTFKDIHLSAADNGFGGRYVFNIDQSGNIGELKFESCVIRSLRGICRMKEGAGVLDKFTISNCVIDSLNNYGVLTVDVFNWQCNEILIEFTTISKAVYFLQSRNNSTSVIINGCTLSELPEISRPAFRWREIGQDNVTNGISITNTIWGHGWDYAATGELGIDGFDGLASTNWNIVNSYATSEFGYAEGKDAIPGFPSVTYSGLVTALWTNPYNSIFDFKDTGFAGSGDSGDPRWRIGL